MGGQQTQTTMHQGGANTPPTMCANALKKRQSMLFNTECSMKLTRKKQTAWTAMRQTESTKGSRSGSEASDEDKKSTNSKEKKPMTSFFAMASQKPVVATAVSSLGVKKSPSVSNWMQNSYQIESCF